MIKFEKLPEREALLQIEFLKNKAEYQKANLEIAISKLLNSSAIFVAIFLGVTFFVYNETKGNLKVVLPSMFLIFLIWGIPTWKRLRLIKKIKGRIFAIGSYIKGIYQLDLGVNVEGVENNLDLLTEKMLLKIKEEKL